MSAPALSTQKAGKAVDHVLPDPLLELVQPARCPWAPSPRNLRHHGQGGGGTGDHEASYGLQWGIRAPNYHETPN